MSANITSPVFALRLLLAECGPSEIPDDEYERDRGADRACRLLALLDRVRDDAKALKAEVDAWVSAWIAANGQLRSGNLIYRLEADKTVVCTDYVGALGALARDQVLLIDGLYFPDVAAEILASGDPGSAVQAFCEDLAERLAESLARFISKNGLTQGGCKKALGDAWGAYFEERRGAELKVQRIDKEIMDMVRKRRGGEPAAVEGEVIE